MMGLPLSDNRAFLGPARLGLVAALLFAGCADSEPESQSPTATTHNLETTVTTAASTVATDEETFESSSTTEGSVAPASFDPEAEVLPQASHFPDDFVLRSGASYLLDVFDARFTLAVGDVELLLWFNDGREAVLSHIQSVGGSDRTISVARAGALNDPANVDREAGAAWPIDDIDSWLDALVKVDVLGREERLVDGRLATVFDLRAASDAQCAEAYFCQQFGFNWSFSTRDILRVYWIDMPDSAPLVISTAVTSQEDADEWFAVMDSLVATIAFDTAGSEGSVELQEGCGDLLSAGVVEIAIAGGLRSSVGQDDRFIVQPQPCHLAVVYEQDPNSQILLMVAERDPAGNALLTAEDVVAFVSGQGAEFTERASTQVAGLDARVFDVVGNDADNGDFNVLAAGADPAGGNQAGWIVPFAGRLWLIESDRGLLLVSAGAFNLGTAAPSVIAEAELLLSTLEFVELSIDS